MKQIKLMLGDNMENLKKLPDNSIDSVVTDAPYGLGKEQDMNKVLKDWMEKGYSEIKGKGFMGKEWDAYVPQPLFWKEIYLILKPGGHVLSFFGTRTYDIGTIVLDIFAGIGTTLKVANRINRNYIGFEISDKYINEYKK